MLEEEEEGALKSFLERASMMVVREAVPASVEERSPCEWVELAIDTVALAGRGGLATCELWRRLGLGAAQHGSLRAAVLRAVRARPGRAEVRERDAASSTGDDGTLVVVATPDERLRALGVPRRARLAGARRIARRSSRARPPHEGGKNPERGCVTLPLSFCL